MSATIDLGATFDVGQNSQALSATFDVGQDSVNLFTKLTVRHSASINLIARFKPAVLFSGPPRVLKSTLFVGVDASQELYAKFDLVETFDIFAEFNIRHTATKDIFCEFRVVVHFVEGWGDVITEAVIRHADTQDLFAEVEIINSDSAELYSKFEVTSSIDFFAKLTVQHANLEELFNKLIVRNAATRDLSSELVVRHSDTKEIYAKFEAIPNESLKGILIVRHSTTKDLHCDFFLRFPYRFWTNRRYLNGVISAAESLIGDAKLEYVIDGVMEDIQTWMLANDLSYAGWDNLTLVPVAIRRATTYGTVASLYARNTKTFTSRVIPTLSPVTVTVKGDEREAMEYWEGRYEQMLELYLTTTGKARMWVSTEDEEPVFSMIGIPSDSSPQTLTDDEIEWHEWLRQRGR